MQSSLEARRKPTSERRASGAAAMQSTARTDWRALFAGCPSGENSANPGRVSSHTPTVLRGPPETPWGRLGTGCGRMGRFCRLRSRQCEADAGAAFWAVLGPDPAAVGLDEAAGDREAEPAPRCERAGSLRQKRSNMRRSASSPSPSPVSSTVTRTASTSGATRTATAPSEGVCRSAFTRRLSSTRSTLSGANRATAPGSTWSRA